tara:strand:+ start:465 stop:617 length:153 start_codon:yes stop_codon:yes gene_type:complete
MCVKFISALPLCVTLPSAWSAASFAVIWNETFGAPERVVCGSIPVSYTHL